MGLGYQDVHLSLNAVFQTWNRRRDVDETKRGGVHSNPARSYLHFWQVLVRWSSELFLPSCY